MPLLPTESVTRTFSVSLAVNVTPASDHVLAPTLVVPVVQVPPLSIDTSTISPDTIFALVVPEIVCAAVLVLKSVPDIPVSAEKAIVAIVVVGAVVSSM